MAAEEFRQRVQSHFRRRRADGYVRADGKALRLFRRQRLTLRHGLAQALQRTVRPSHLAQSRRAAALRRLLGPELRPHRAAH